MPGDGNTIRYGSNAFMTNWWAFTGDWDTAIKSGMGLVENAIFVDHANTGLEDGTFEHPFNTVAKGVARAAPGNTVAIKAGNYPETLTVTKRLRLLALGGSVTIGK